MMKMKTKIEKFVDKEIEEDKKWLKDEIKHLNFSGIITSLCVLLYDIKTREDTIDFLEYMTTNYTKKRLKEILS